MSLQDVASAFDTEADKQEGTGSQEVAENKDVVTEGMEQNISESLVREYYTVNQTKLDAEKKVKELKPRVTAALAVIGKDSTRVGDLLVSYKPKQITTLTDKEGLIALLTAKAPECVYSAIDDDLLNKAIEEGRINMEDITGFYSKVPGSAALVIKPAKKGEE